MLIRMLAGVLCGTLCLFNCARAGEGDVIRVGERAPMISGVSTDGSTVSLDAYKGNPILLVFFATWCGGCAQELPKIERELQQRYKESGLVVIGVGRGAGFSELAQFKRNKGFSFTIIEDPRRQLYSKYASDYIPRCYLIGKDGVVKYAITGVNDYDFNQLKRKTADEMAAQTPRQ